MLFVIIRLSEIIERETEAYYKMDPDPFDDRHPGKLNKNEKQYQCIVFVYNHTLFSVVFCLF